MRYRRLLPPIVSIMLALAPSPASTQGETPDPQFERFRERFHGTWRLEGTVERARTTVDAAIEQTVNAMNFFVRPIARTQLRDNTPLNRRIDIFFRDGQRINVRFDERYSYTSRIGRTTRVTTPEGDEMRVTQRFRDDGTLEQVFETDQGTRWNVYTITDDGMTCGATTQGMMMPQPLYFSLSYRRAE
jgi:hypothetical protein